MSMHHSLRSVAALSLLGWVTMFGVEGCSNRLGPVQATQNGGSLERPNLPDISVEQFRECMADFGRQLAPGRVVLRSTINVNEDGDKQGSDIDGIPQQAADFSACMQNALRELPIAERPFREGVQMLRFHRKHAMDSDRAFVEFLRTIPGVPIVGSELVLEADGYTVELDVKVNVVANPERVIDDNNRTVGKLGMMAIGSLGYDEIMNRAEQQGWVRKVRRNQQPSPAEKSLVGDAATATAEFGRIMSRGLVYAGISSQLDTPAPGIGDAIGVGIIAGALLYAGAVAVNELLTTTATTTTATPAATTTTTPTPTTTTTTTAAPTTTTTSPPIPIGVPTTTTAPPATSNRNRWQCSASCNVQQINQKAVCPDRVTGNAGGPNEPAACVEAKRSATQSTPVGCYPRHCQCRCSRK